MRWCTYRLDATPFSFTLTAFPSSLTIARGKAASTAAITALTSGNAQGIALSASGLPSGVMSSFASIFCNPACSSVLILRTSVSVPPGNYPVVESATDGGVTQIVGVGLTISAISSPSPSLFPLTPASCNLYTPGSAIPSGYGLPWDMLSGMNEMLIKATGTSASNTTVDFGKGSATQYIYKTGYHYRTGISGWSPISLSSSETLVSSNWYPKTANTTLSGLDLTNTTHYVLGYVCSWTGSQWKCGCRDASCTQSYWQIQSFKR